MKLSHQHSTGGVTVSIGNRATGQVVLFTFPKGATRMPVAVVVGDKHLNATLKIKPFETDRFDEVDLEVSLLVPEIDALDAEVAPTKPTAPDGGAPTKNDAPEPLPLDYVAPLEENSPHIRAQSEPDEPFDPYAHREKVGGHEAPPLVIQPDPEPVKAPPQPKNPKSAKR